MASSGPTADTRFERAVLSLLLAGGVPVAKLIEEIGDRAAALRALDRLQAVGLAVCEGDLAAPSAAARRFDELGI